MNNIPSGLKRPLQEAIEVRLWEIYLLRSRNNLSNYLSAYALTEPEAHPHPNRESARISFQFLLSDWDKTISETLMKNHIPYEIISTFKTDIYRQPTKKKVYVAEDDLNILFALNTMLEDAGYDVVLSHCGAPMLKANLPSTDVIILDNRMPDVDGIEVCQHLKNQPSTRHIPVIMISAFRNFGSQAVKAGVDEFLEKPFEMHELLRLVAKHTANSERNTLVTS
jgi:CheY-like chemotaxis protein